MSTYTPDAWVVVEFNSLEFGKVQKIFAGWYGGYLGSDSWKLSSGNLQEFSDGDYYMFPQESGSVYRCHKDCQRMTGYMSQVLHDFRTQIEQAKAGTVEIIPFNGV